jgi:hypothetical protein
LSIAISIVLTKTISIPEVGWTFISLFAAIYVGKLFKRAVGNLQWLKQNKWNGTREDAARVSVLVYGAMLFVTTANTTAGLIAMLIPSTSATSVHPLTYVVTAIFILKSLFIAGCAYLIDHLQLRIIETTYKGAGRRESDV